MITRTSSSSDPFQVMPAFISLPSTDLLLVLTLSPTFNCSDIVQTPLAVPVPVRARSTTPFPDDSRPGTPLSGKHIECTSFASHYKFNVSCSFFILSGDLRVDIKKITDKFFAPGTRTTNFLNSFVRGEGSLPLTTGPIAGLPRAWRRGFGVPAESRYRAVC